MELQMISDGGVQYVLQAAVDPEEISAVDGEPVAISNFTITGTEVGFVAGIGGLSWSDFKVGYGGYYYQNVLRTALFAEILGKTADAANYRSLAENIRKSFVEKFANADGSFADDSLTGAAAAVYFGFVEGAEAEKSVKYLVDQVRQQEHKANFGILGSKYIPRVLADYGCADDAFFGEVLRAKQLQSGCGEGLTGVGESFFHQCVPRKVGHGGDTAAN